MRFNTTGGLGWVAIIKEADLKIEKSAKWLQFIELNSINWWLQSMNLNQQILDNSQADGNS